MSDQGYELREGVDVEFETSGPESHFFGYYDKSPVDASGNRVLSHRVTFDGRPVRADDRATVGYWSLNDGEFTELGETAAFNWQQGSMLQWLPPDYNRRVIYNDRGEESFRSVIVNVETGEETILSSPIYAVHPSGKFALGANFERLHFCRPGYSYSGIENSEWNRHVHPDDGIFRVDLNTGERDLIVSTEAIVKDDPQPSFESVDHWLEHMMWNPSGTRFAFLHRWETDEGFATRLYTADPDGSNRYQFPYTGHYSHMDWKNDKEFTIYGAKPSTYQSTEQFVRDNPILSAVVTPIYRFLRDQIIGDELDEALPSREFLTFKDRDDDFNVLNIGFQNEDGHITWTSDERWLLVDSYPDTHNRQHLALYDTIEDELHELASFQAAFSDTAYRCDLHPRWDNNESSIIVDSAHDGSRQMLVLNQPFVG